MTLVYGIIAITALLAFVSLGVDYGRVQSAKTQLEYAADAAARYAVNGIADGTYVAKAQTAASDNLCDCSPVTLLNADVTLGTWSSGTFSSGGASPNAIRVIAHRAGSRNTAIPLLFAKVLGLAQCDIHATSIATISSIPAQAYGVVGLSSISGSGNIVVDSYNSTSSSYSFGSHLSNGDTATNGTITLSGSSTIYGDGYYYGGYTHSGTASVTGNKQMLSSTISEPNPTLPGSYTNMGSYTSLGYGSETLNAGNYYYTSFTLSGSHTINTSGQVNLYVNGAVDISGATSLAGSNPNSVHIFVMNNSAVSITGSGTLSAVVYAPQSVLTISGSSYLLGSAIANSINLSGSAAIHVDESVVTGSGSGSSAGTISLVN
jgi:hypothetical protein